jgi:hypothetical protein
VYIVEFASLFPRNLWHVRLVKKATMTKAPKGINPNSKAKATSNPSYKSYFEKGGLLRDKLYMKL